MLQLWDGFKCVLQEIVRKCEELSLKYNAWSYQNRNTGLVWPCFRNQTTIICAVILPIKSPIQPFFFFWNYKEVNDTWHLIPQLYTSTCINVNRHTPSEIVMALLVSQRWVWFKWVITFKESIRGQQRIPGGLISTPVILWDKGSQENGRKVLCQGTLGLWEMGSLGLGSLLHQWRIDTVVHTLHNDTVIPIQGHATNNTAQTATTLCQAYVTY